MNTKGPHKNIIDIKYVDGIMIVDDKGKIMYSVRYNPRFDNEYNENEFQKLIDRNFLEVYPTVKYNDSTIVNCLRTGVPTYSEDQLFYDYRGRPINTKNLTIPIIKRGKVLGAVELSEDITTIQDISDEYNSFKIYVNHSHESQEQKSPLFSFNNIITRNKSMIDNITRAKLIANSPSSVLIYGETGTGKELFVQSIHNYSFRKNKPFIAQNCAALPETLFESILFGTVKGAFTGATDTPGLFELADGGTLFLDEINSMPLNLQSKLLRVIQDGFIRRIGDTKERKVDVRIITAMNRDIHDAINTNQIREDLFYRLNCMSIKLTPLRERKNDIPLLVDHFINKYNYVLKKSVNGITHDVEDILYSYNWPGNVRELEHIIEAAMNIIIDGNEIEVKHLPVYLNDIIQQSDSFTETNEIKPLSVTIEDIERKMIIKAVKKAHGNISKAANILKLPRQTLQYKINKYDIKFLEEA